jgi:hypothetical protein
VKHHATTKFWSAYYALPQDIQKIADKNFEILKDDPYHPSLHFKKVGLYWSVRAGLAYRALGVLEDDTIIWFWIGTHARYDQLIK